MSEKSGFESMIQISIMYTQKYGAYRILENTIA